MSQGTAGAHQGLPVQVFSPSSRRPHRLPPRHHSRVGCRRRRPRDLGVRTIGVQTQPCPQAQTQARPPGPDGRSRAPPPWPSARSKPPRPGRERPAHSTREEHSHIIREAGPPRCQEGGADVQRLRACTRPCGLERRAVGGAAPRPGRPAPGGGRARRSPRPRSPPPPPCWPRPPAAPPGAPARPHCAAVPTHHTAVSTAMSTAGPAGQDGACSRPAQAGLWTRLWCLQW